MTDEELEQLREYAELEGTEFGEVNIILLDLLGWDGVLSDGFNKTVARELKANLKWFKKNCRIVSKNVTVVTQTHKELEYL